MGILLWDARVHTEHTFFLTRGNVLCQIFAIVVQNSPFILPSSGLLPYHKHKYTYVFFHSWVEKAPPLRLRQFVYTSRPAPLVKAVSTPNRAGYFISGRSLSISVLLSASCDRSKRKIYKVITPSPCFIWQSTILLLSKSCFDDTLRLVSCSTVLVDWRNPPSCVCQLYWRTCGWKLDGFLSSVVVFRVRN